MYPCTVREAQYGSNTQRSNAETREGSEKKIHARATYVCLLVQSMLTASSGCIVTFYGGTAGVSPVGSADPQHPAVLAIAPEVPVAVSAGLTQAAHAELIHWIH